MHVRPLSLKLIMGTLDDSKVGHVHNLDLTMWSPQCISLHSPEPSIFLFPRAFDALLLSVYPCNFLSQLSLNLQFTKFSYFCLYFSLSIGS